MNIMKAEVGGYFNNSAVCFFFFSNQETLTFSSVKGFFGHEAIILIAD